VAPPRALRDNGAETVRGITLVCLCFFAMTLGDVSAKWALPALGPAGIMIGRGLPGGLTVFGYAMLRNDSGPVGWRRLRPVRWPLALLRAVLASLTTAIWFIVWQTMALADSYAIGFTQPLMMTLLAIPLLGERIRWRRVAATLVGFAGVLIMVRPGGDLWTPTVALLMLGVLGMAIGRILTRLLSTTETAESLALLPLLVHLPIGLLFLPFFPVHGFAWDALVAVVLVGIFNATGQWLNARAYALAPVMALAPYEYTPLLWGGVLAYFLFHEVPHASALAGAAVVAAAGLYNLHREQARRRGEAAEAGVAALLPRTAP
jgi:drug/metabolite transporter (DMT)-like permease